ncbi:MAG TPA: MBL fold metallo-hydrolase [Acidimicrobiales bacterium]|nr:MBL fold metallo-hydrolase [Acidimicrobiales bacterium]
MPDFGVGPAPEPGRLDKVAPSVRRLTAPNPGLMTGPGTNTYLVGDAEMVVVDPGPDDATHTAAIVAAAEPLGSIRTIVVTHTHVDHAPGAAALAAATGARIVGFGPAEGFVPDERVGEGWSLTCALTSGAVGSPPGLTLRALHTPGHASDHLCWLIEENALLFTGDHVMHGSTVVIRPPDGDLHQYLTSLARVRDEVPPIRTLAPGHGRQMDHVPDVIDALIAHRLGRHERVAEVLARRGEGSVDELLGEVYGDVTQRQLPVARFSLWAHLRALTQEGRATFVGPVEAGNQADTLESRWVA